MDRATFARMLGEALANPSASERKDAPGRFDSRRWAHAVAAEAAQRLDAYGGAGASRLPKSWRADTATGLFEEQLRHVMAQEYDRPYPGLQARTFMPPAAGIPAGAETVVQRGYDITGRPELVVNEARDIPRVSLQGRESHSRVVGLGIKWGINYDEMLAAAMAGVALDGKGLTAARTIQEREIDLLLALGDAQYGVIGIANQATKVWGAAGAGVQLAVAGAPVAFTANWDTVATAPQILTDFAILKTSYSAGNVHFPTDCAMGSATYARLETLTVVAGTTDTVLEVLRRLYPGITFRQWWRLDTAGAGGGERVMLFERGSACAESIVSLEPTMLQPTWDGFGWETVCYARCGGIQAADTTAMVYADM